MPVLPVPASSSAGRDHYRRVYRTAERRASRDTELLSRIRQRLGALLAAEEPAEKNWYKMGSSDIAVRCPDAKGGVAPLSTFSTVVREIGASDQVFFYSRPEQVDAAAKIVEDVLNGLE